MRLLPTLAAVPLLAACVVAHADIYTVTFTGTEAGGLPNPIPYTDSFTFDSSVRLSHPGDGYDVAPCYPPNCFSTPTLPDNGVTTRDFVRNEGIINYYGDLFGTEEVLSFYTNSNFAGPIVSPFTGPSTDPVITLGTFYAEVGFPFESLQEQGTATVVDDTLAPVPEPSTLALLGTGALGLVGTVRRRLSA